MPFGMRWEDDIAALGTVKLAVDVGANEGQTADLLGRAFPDAQIFSYEPVPSTFNVLQRRYAGSRHVTCIRAAVGATSGSAKMVSGAISSQNTLLTHAKPDQPTVLVPMTTIALQADAYGWDHIDLLKSDTEGYELPVLEGALPVLEQARIRFILAECDFMTRPTEPHTYFPDLFAMLSPLGYRVVAFYTAGVDGQGWVWGNVLFMKGSARRDVLLTPSAVRPLAGARCKIWQRRTARWRLLCCLRSAALSRRSPARAAGRRLRDHDRAGKDRDGGLMPQPAPQP